MPSVISSTSPLSPKHCAKRHWLDASASMLVEQGWEACASMGVDEMRCPFGRYRQEAVGACRVRFL